MQLNGGQVFRYGSVGDPEGFTLDRVTLSPPESSSATSGRG
jgi:hypothetical protein